MLALAQKGAATGGIERLIALAGNMVAVYPEVKDNIDPDAVIREMNELLGNPSKILNGMDLVNKIRAANAKKQQQLEQMQALQHTAQTASIGADAAQTMSQTDVGGGQNVLAALLGGQK